MSQSGCKNNLSLLLGWLTVIPSRSLSSSVQWTFSGFSYLSRLFLLLQVLLAVFKSADLSQSWSEIDFSRRLCCCLNDGVVIVKREREREH